MVSIVSNSCSQNQRISLRLWVFKFIDVEETETFEVCIEGYRPSDDTATVLRNWHSTAIEKRLSSTLLASRSGTIYELRGSIDRELAYQYGYPVDLVTAFANGFPENWKSILEEYFHVVKTANPLNAAHYYSMLARRRSHNTVRGKNVVQSDRRGERLSSIAPSVTACDAIIEESEHEKTVNSTDKDAEIGRSEEQMSVDASDKFSTTSFRKNEDERMERSTTQAPNNAKVRIFSQSSSQHSGW
ncbi:SANTA protein [Cooperia oncophora]